ncbi:hypothetical protein Cgig2_028494 [Carnegiea gigantea]|uniref:PDZ domain-containing protein n=1 Tax=Carnegiea gigantea TaxID=171969 RepID=A0A9Q1Q7B6_9CARY|nr:hypothetical protein Cgig2_028494 [Carnegiea gigantea]
MVASVTGEGATLKCISDDLAILPTFLRNEGYKVLIPGSKVIALAPYCGRSVLTHQCGAFRNIRRPWHGMMVASLYAADIAFLEKITRKFPSVSKGALVRKVEKESPAEVAGFLPDDVIIRCDGKAVACSLKFFEEMLDASGESIEVEVVRLTGEHLKLSVLVEQTILQRYNRWPVYNWRLPDRIAMQRRIQHHVGY